MFEQPSYVEYEIRTDGTCSYCGREADWIELPDGNAGWSNFCEHCDEYNLEQKIAWAARHDNEPDDFGISPRG